MSMKGHGQGYPSKPLQLDECEVEILAHPNGGVTIVNPDGFYHLIFTKEQWEKVLSFLESEKRK